MVEKNDQSLGPIFVSYSRNDWDEFASPLVERLRSEGFDVWVDQELIRGGTDWLDAINNALDRCPQMILCVSPDSLASRYVKMEYRYFIGENKFLLPVICRKIDLPAELRGIQNADWDNPDLIVKWLKADTTEEFEVLQKAVESASVDTASDLVKRYITNRRHRIQLHDLVMGESERVHEAISAEHFPIDTVFNSEELVERLTKYEDLTKTLQAILVTGCYWGEEEHTEVWAQSLQRVANPPEANVNRFYEVWKNLRLYPALILVYAGGMAAIAKGNYSTFAALLTEPTVEEYGQRRRLVEMVYTWRVLESRIAKQHIPGLENHHTPLSDHLFGLMRNPLRAYLLDDSSYTRAFDRFEYLYGLVHADFYSQERDRVWGPVGNFGWRYARLGSNDYSTMTEIKDEVSSLGENWPPLTAGLFGGSPERFLEVKQEFDKLVAGLRWW